MKTGALLVGSQDVCQAYIRNIQGFYVYILRRPDRRPFYVGKGSGPRVVHHENEARHPNDRLSNIYKLNVIRSIWRSGGAVVYEIDYVAIDENSAYAREVELIGYFKRLHEGGPLTNLDPGGGSSAGIAPASKEKHSATLGGIPDNNPDRATLNRFVLSIKKMGSVVIKPIGQFIARPTKPFPKRAVGPTLRTAVATVASAAANRVSMDGCCQIPRRLTVEGVYGCVENGVACAVLESGMGTIIPSADPADERFHLTAKQARQAVGLVGLQKCIDLGVLSSEAMFIAGNVR